MVFARRHVSACRDGRSLRSVDARGLRLRVRVRSADRRRSRWARQPAAGLHQWRGPRHGDCCAVPQRQQCSGQQSLRSHRSRRRRHLRERQRLEHRRLRADRSPGVEHRGVCTRPAASPPACRRSRRTVLGRNPTGPWIRRTPGPDGRSVRGRSPSAGSTDVPHRRPRPVACRRHSRLHRAQRLPGEDPRSAHRTRRGTGSADLRRRRRRGRGGRPRGSGNRRSHARRLHHGVGRSIPRHGRHPPRTPKDIARVHDPVGDRGTRPDPHHVERQARQPGVAGSSVHPHPGHDGRPSRRPRTRTVPIVLGHTRTRDRQRRGIILRSRGQFTARHQDRRPVDRAGRPTYRHQDPVRGTHPCGSGRGVAGHGCRRVTDPTRSSRHHHQGGHHRSHPDPPVGGPAAGVVHQPVRSGVGRLQHPVPPDASWHARPRRTGTGTGRCRRTSAGVADGVPTRR